MTDWGVWARGVLQNIGAPVTVDNLVSLWNWSWKESAPNVMRWNNPLNTTLRLPGSVSMNSAGVQRFASVADGITATLKTLGNGLYQTILFDLQHNLPHWQWQNACQELNKWGSGCDWLGWEQMPAAEDLVLTPTPNPNAGGKNMDVYQLKFVLVRLSYLAAIGREPESPDVVNGWVKSIADDLSNLDSVIVQIVDSPEARAHLASEKAGA